MYFFLNKVLFSDSVDLLLTLYKLYFIDLWNKTFNGINFQAKHINYCVVKTDHMFPIHVLCDFSNLSVWG